jgi:hypothetical protein
MSSLAEKLRAAALSEQRQSNDQSTQQYGIAEQRKTIASHHNDNPPRPSIAEKLRAAVVIATPRQNELENSSRAVAKNDEPSRKTMSLAEKLKAAAAAEKLKQNDTDVLVTNNRPRATTKLLAAVDVAKFTGATTPWGSCTYLEKCNIEDLSNEKLRKHLAARGATTEGGKKELIDRLMESLEDEKQRELALKLELENKHRHLADLEESGAVYSVGKNNLGQLGVGDFDDRLNFTVIPFSRGRKCLHVSTSGGANMSLATTENNEVFCWGGGGMGPMGIKGKNRAEFESPQLVVKLNGEETVMTAIGANHCIAVSQGGDIFSWGNGHFGVLGTGDSKKHETPIFIDCFDVGISIVSATCGEQHTCIKTSQNEVYAWGHASNGRLGMGRMKNDELFQASPYQIQFPLHVVVRQIACGSEHTLASTDSTVFSWGTGDGGRLGHGSNHSDRWEPVEIVALRGSHILDISAGLFLSY